MPYETIGVKLELDNATIKRLGDATVKDALEAAGKVLVSDIKDSFSGGGGRYSKPAEGRWYYKTGRALKARRAAEARGEESTKWAHRASAQGQPPAVDSGRLRDSIDSVMMPGNQRVLIGTPMKYAGPLEFGTRSGKIKPRPFFRPAVYRYRGNNDLMKKVVYQLRVTGKVK